MRQYIIRLDDASDYMDSSKWKRIEEILDKYGIKPIFGIIPKNGDDALISKYEQDTSFWKLVHEWIKKGWIPAMHGYEHRYVTKEGGINPVNKRSEFAGLSFEEQATKIRHGYSILVEHDVQPKIFFAPSHTFDSNTLKALKCETPIRIISDTIAWDIYKNGDFWFIPQQSGRVRSLPFKLTTFCYHPNTMNDHAYEELESFLLKKRELFISNLNVDEVKRGLTLTDKVLQKIYFAIH